MAKCWTILLTGASTGLGLAVAQQLVRTPHRVILTAREQSLKRLAEAGFVESDRLWLRTMDVTDAVQRARIVHEANHRWHGIDVLINNAGVSFRSVVEHVTERERLAQMTVNFLAPMELTRLVLPSMRAKRAGRILNISSVGGMMAMPTMAVYSASKFALEGATEALFYEVRPWNIKVSLIEPGFIHSESFKNVRYTRLSDKSNRNTHEPYHAHYENMGPFIERTMYRARSTPETVARRILRVMHRRWPPLRVPATIDAYLFSLMRRVLPRRFYHWVLYRSLPRVRVWGPGSHTPHRRKPQTLPAAKNKES